MTIRSRQARAGRVTGDVSGHDDAPFRFGVEERTLRDGGAGHLLQTETLRAELDLVGAVGFGLPRLYSIGKRSLAALDLPERRHRRRPRGSAV
jgi:hypothetical protein